MSDVLDGIHRNACLFCQGTESRAQALLPDDINQLDYPPISAIRKKRYGMGGVLRPT